MNGNNAYETLHGGGFKTYYRENNGREGLFINIQALSMKVFGSTSFALRVVSAIFGIATVCAIFAFARAYTGEYLGAQRLAGLAIGDKNYAFYNSGPVVVYRSTLNGLDIIHRAVLKVRAPDGELNTIVMTFVTIGLPDPSKNTGIPSGA